MELHDLVLSAAVFDERLAQLLREVGLPGTWWAVQDDLALVVEQTDRLTEPVDWKQESIGEVLVRHWQLTIDRACGGGGLFHDVECDPTQLRELGQEGREVAHG
jgi:hypothetical protein